METSKEKKEIKNEPLVGCMNDYNGIFYTTVNTIILELKLPYIYIYIYIYISILSYNLKGFH